MEVKIKTGVPLFGTHVCSTFLVRRCRFDCGAGAGRARTDNSVLLGRWNVIHVHRHGRSGWIQINDGPRSLVRSKVCVSGHFSLHYLLLFYCELPYRNHGVHVTNSRRSYTNLQ